MGLADLPRVYFSGFTYWNPSTMNNNDNQPTYDPASATLNWDWLERRGLQDASGFDGFVTQAAIAPAANDALLPGLSTDAPPAEWNFYGDNSCGFVQEEEPVIEWPAMFGKPPGGLTATGYTATSGAYVASGDPWITETIQLNAGLDAAKLVDVDPICPWSSQIFVDTATLGCARRGVGMTGSTAGRAHSRWGFFARNLNLSGDVIIAGIGSAMWQLALPSSGLEFFDPTPAPGSVQQALQQALTQPRVRGLMARFVTYHTVYFQGNAFKIHSAPDWATIAELYAQYAAAATAYERGELDTPPPRPVNRAYSNTVGWIAPWTTADMRSMAAGRVLHAGEPIQPVGLPKLGPTGLGPAALEYSADVTDPTRVGRVSVDLGSTVPELDSTLTKVNFGELELALADSDGANLTPFARIEYVGGYDTDAYLRSAGVVDIPASAFLMPVTVASLEGSRLALTAADPAGRGVQLALLEADYTAETDDRATYLNERDAPEPGGQSITIQIRHRGGKPPPGTRLRVAQYSPDPPGFGEGGWELVSETRAAAQAPYLRLIGAGHVEDGAYLTLEVPHEDDGLPYGTATLSVAALRPGPPVLQFTPLSPTAPDGAPDSTIGFPRLTQAHFANVRGLPFHNDLATSFENWLRTGPTVDLVTQRVFDTVFRNFFMMYPAMRFLADPLRFQAWRGKICAVTDPAVFETAAYMPVTRSLSAGQRRVLELWSAYVDGQLPTPIRRRSLGRRG